MSIEIKPNINKGEMINNDTITHEVIKYLYEHGETFWRDITTEDKGAVASVLSTLVKQTKVIRTKRGYYKISDKWPKHVLLKTVRTS